MIDIKTAVQSLYKAANANVAYKTSSWTSEKQFKPNPIYKQREFRKDQRMSPVFRQTIGTIQHHTLENECSKYDRRCCFGVKGTA